MCIHGRCIIWLLKDEPSVAVWGWTRDSRSILAPLCHSPQEGWEGEGAVVTAVMDLPKLEELTFPLLFMVPTDQQLQLSVRLPLPQKI